MLLALLALGCQVDDSRSCAELADARHALAAEFSAISARMAALPLGYSGGHLTALEVERIELARQRTILDARISQQCPSDAR